MSFRGVLQTPTRIAIILTMAGIGIAIVVELIKLTWTLVRKE